MEFYRAVPPFILLILLVFSHSLSADEVYRWTDENGKVHFSDNANKRPRNQDGQENIEVEQIKVKPTNSADKPNSFERIYQSTDQQKRHESEQNQAQRERQQQLSERRKQCAEMREFIDQFGRRGNRITYLVDENGESLTEREQKAELEKMRREMERTGCS